MKSGRNLLEAYTTLNTLGTSEEEIRNSVFIGYASPVKDEKEARDFIQMVKSRHADADHNVYAYVIKSDKNLAIKYDDDGEPAGSSGKPIYKVLEMKELNNVAVVVTRYFWGIKLGFGGLAKAYRETAAKAIENAGYLEVRERSIVRIKLEYPDIQKVKMTVLQHGIIIEEDFSENVLFRVEIDSDKKDIFIEQLINATKNRVQIEISK